MQGPSQICLPPWISAWRISAQRSGAQWRASRTAAVGEAGRGTSVEETLFTTVGLKMAMLDLGLTAAFELQ